MVAMHVVHCFAAYPRGTDLAHLFDVSVHEWNTPRTGIMMLASRTYLVQTRMLSVPFVLPLVNGGHRQIGHYRGYRAHIGI